MGAIAGTALLARTKPAAADKGGNGNGNEGNGKGNGGPEGGNCFLKGTWIRTVLGERPVEALVAGDLLPTHFGGMRPIQWIGRYLFKRNDPSKPWVKDVRPVRVARSALAPETPHADLYLSQGHALYVDGALVPVASLINGTTIALHEAEECDELEYFHIKLETHDVILAHGAPCETLLTVDEKADNFAEYFREFGTPQGEDRPCAPVLQFDGASSELKSRLRSAISPWFDRRQPIDVIRDRLEERALAL
ncbi:MAG: Hint domain-containing protein [Hyphomicrobiales bacterium]